MSIPVRPFGKTGVPVSEIGIGTWGMGGNMWGGRDDDSAKEALAAALDSGITFIDTAAVYGNGHSEDLIGAVLAVHPKAAQAFVATKVPAKNMQWPARAKTPVVDAFPPEHIISYTEYSLKHLKRDYIDLQQLHVWHDAWLSEPIWLDAIETLKHQGKIKYFGVSINDHETATALKLVASGLIDSVQVIYNIFDQSPEDELFPLCQKHGVGVIVRVPFDEGSLTGTFDAATQFAKGDWRSHYFTPERMPQVLERVRALEFLTQDRQRTLADAALKFCLSHPAVSTVIPGMRKLKHVAANCAVSQTPPFTAQELAQIKSHRWIRNFYPYR